MISQADQTIFILTTKIKDEKQLPELQEPLLNLLKKSISLPNLQSGEVKALPKLAAKEQLISKILPHTSFSITFDPEFVKKEFLSNPTLIKKANDYISILILYYYLSFNLCNQHNTDDIQTMLKALLLIIDYELISSNKMYAKIAKSAFATIILNSSLKINYFKIVNCLLVYFDKTDIPIETSAVLIMMMEQISNLQNQEEQLGILTNLISNIYHSNPAMISSDFIHQMFINLRFHLINLSPIAIDFFAEWAERINDEDLKILIQAFPSTIFAYYDRMKTHLTLIDFSNTHNNSTNVTINIPHSLSDIQNIPQLDQNLFELDDLNFRDFYKLVQIAHSKNDKFINEFITQILLQLKDEQSLLYYELLAIYLHLLIEVSPIQNDISFLFSNPYFSDSLISDCHSYELDINISSIRYLLMKLLMVQNEDFIFSIFDQMMNKPLIFAEFCYRLIYVPDDIKKCVLISKFFRSYDKCSDHTESRVATLLAFNSYFSSDSMITRLFNDKTLYKYFMEVIEFGSITKINFVYQFLLNCFKTKNELVNPQFLNYLTEYFGEFVNTYLLSGKESVLQTISRCITFSFSLLNEVNSLISNFERYFEKLRELISDLPKNNPDSKQLYIQIFQLFSVREFTHNELSSVEATASSIFVEKAELKQFLQSLMASFQNESELFLINQPKAVNVLLKMLNGDKTILQYCTDLCNYSPINSVQFHHAGLDSLLIDFLLQLKIKNDTEDQTETEKLKSLEEFKNAFNLFLSIAKFASSVSIINRYMSLLCNNPENNRVSDFHSILVNGLIYLSEESNKIPMTAITDVNLTYDSIEVDSAGFTVCVWIFVPVLFDSSRDESLITITEHSTKFDIHICNTGFNVYINSELVEKTIPSPIELSRWTCVTFRIQSSKTFVFINNEEKGQVSYPAFSIRNLGITFKASNRFFLGGMTVYKKVITTNLFEKGARKIWEDPKHNAVLAIRPLWHSNILILQTKFHNEITYKITGKRSFSVLNFIDILCVRCGVTLILPLLAQINMENAHPKLLQSILTLVRNLLLERAISQRKFSEMKGAQILAYLLAVSNTAHIDKNKASKSIQNNNAYLTCDLYKQLLDIFHIITSQKLKKTFCKYIIMNFSLWIRGMPEEVVKIFDLIAQLDNHAIWKLLNITFAAAVASIRVFFSHSHIPNINHFNGSDEQYSHIRKSILIACRNVLDSKNLDGHFRIILAHLKCSPNLTDDLDILHLLHLLIEYDNNNGKRISQKSKLMICFLLRKCVKRSNISNLLGQDNQEIDFEISTNVILAYYDVFAKTDFHSSFNDLNFSQSDLVYFLMRWIHDSYICEAFLNKLIPLINGDYPLLYQLGAMISVSLGEGMFLKFLKDVTFKPILYEFDEDLWPLWMVIGVYSSSDNGINEGFDFILNNTPIEKWKKVYQIIEAFSLAFKPHFKVIKMFIHKIYERINSKQISDLFIDFASSLTLFMKSCCSALSKKQTKSQIKFANDTNDIAQHNLSPSTVAKKKKRISAFSHTDLEKQSAWESLYYHFEHRNESNDPNLNKKLSMSTLDRKLEVVIDKITLYEKILDKQNDEDEYQGDDWFDYSIIEKVIQSFLKYPNEIYYDMMIFLESYRLKFTKDEKVVNLQLMKLIDQSRLRYFNYVAYFNQVCKEFNLESPFSDTSEGDIYRIPEISILNRFKEEFSIVKDRLGNIKQLYDTFEKKENDSTNKLYNQTLQDYITRVGLRISKSRKYWHLFCNTNMAGSESPWHSAIQSSKIFYKRDTSSCFCFCPAKLKINHKYDQHVMASLKRDTGSQKMAEELYQEFLNKRVKKDSGYYEELFDISEKFAGNEIEDISNYIFQVECEIIKISKTTKALFTLFKTGIVIQTDDKVKKYSLRSIERILLRDFLHRPTAIEIFMNTGVSVFINFPENISTIHINEQIYSQIILLHPKKLLSPSNSPLLNNFGIPVADIQRCSLIDYFNSKRITEMWVENKISNFEYLVYLNIYSSRSFLNASQYPFLPWIIQEYKKDVLSVKSIRPLSKPIGALNQVRLGELLLKYLDKKETGLDPFIYSSGPMTPISLFYWFIRIEPFATFHIEMQSGSFDNPARIFSSWETAFEQVMNIDGAFRELPPEAFYCHRFMINYNDFDLGLKDENSELSSENLQDVILPPWAHTPMDFIYINRKMLETEYVSRNLHDWIDLIWGPKQNGELAEEALNVFRPEIYHNVWETEFGQNEDNAPLIEAYLAQVGQIPIQLFSTPHPKKKVFIQAQPEPSSMTEQSSSNEDTKEVVLDEKRDPKTINNPNDRILLKTERIYVQELKSCFAITTSFKRKQYDESMDYNVPDNELVIYGISESADVTIIRIGYNIIIKRNIDNIVDEEKASPKRTKTRHSLFSPIYNLLSPSKNERDAHHLSIVPKPIFKDSENLYIIHAIIKNAYKLEEDFDAKKKSAPDKNLKLRFKFFDDTKLCYTDNFSHELIYYDNLEKTQSKKRLLLENQNKITCIDFDNKCFISAFDFDGFLSVIQIDTTNKPNTKNESPIRSSVNLDVLFTIPSFHEKVHSCAISDDFHQIVCGSNDGSILIASLSTRTFIRKIALEKRQKAKHLLITKAWGFILAVITELIEGKTKTWLAVYTINGDFIRKKPISHTIKKIITWRTKTGFDFFTFATPENQIFYGEVYTLDIYEQSYTVDDTIMAMDYDYDLEAAIVISKDGYITFFPCRANPPDF